MRIEIPVNDIESSGIQKSAAFQIKASGHAFKILSSSLYSDKIAAIIRELSANAYDSHVAAGKKDVPIVLHMPTRREPWFAVTDQGVGLDHDEVISLYTTYFSSTKSQSNDFVGAFGLGSKSPFAYTNSFSIASTKDGVKRVYSAYVSDEFVPQINTMSETPTTEPNGLTVTVPVKEADVYEFEQKAAQICYYFEPYPAGLQKRTDLVVSTFIDTSKRLEVLSFKEDSTYSGYSKQPMVIQGVVAYRFDIQQVRTKLSHTDLNLLAAINYNLRVPMGTVEVAASREELSYTPKTIDYLADLIKAALPELRKHVRVTFDTLTSRVEAADYLRTNRVIADSVLMDNKHKYLGIIHRNDAALSRVVDASTGKYKLTDFGDDIKIHVKDGAKAWKEVKTEYNEKNVKTWDITGMQFLMSKTSAEWYLLDEQKYWKAKITEAHTYNRKQIYVFQCSNAAKIDAIEKYLGVKLTKLSSLTYNRKVGASQIVTGNIGFDVTGRVSSGPRWAPAFTMAKLADFKGHGNRDTYYINIRHNTPFFNNGQEVTYNNLQEIIEDFGAKTARVMMVRPAGKAHIPKHWINIEDLFIQGFEALKPKYRYEDINASLKSFCNRIKKDYLSQMQNKFVLEMVEALTNDVDATAGALYDKWLGIYEKLTGKKLPVVPSADELVYKFHEDFPLLNIHNMNGSKEYLQHAVKYLNMLA